MISGLIVYNDYDAKSNRFFINKCLEILNDERFSLIFVEEEKLLEYVSTNKVDFVIYRGRNYLLLEQLENRGIKTFNNIITNKTANDKYLTYCFLKENNLPYIETYLEPQVFPSIMKSASGHGGQEVFLANNHDELMQICNKYNQNDLIVQQLADKGKDKRTYIIDNKIILSMLRTSSKDFRSNFSLGGKAELSSQTDEEKQLINKVLKLFYFDFAGIDIIYKNNKPYINEIEDVVGSRMVYKYTDIDIVKKYINHIQRIYENEI